ncbi:MAG: TrmJ/YjtD family RNA methyltransferase [Candidatus Micrarchaeaceae archaeon]
MPARIKLIVQEPKYQLNVGYIARTAKNFGIKKLFFVKPRTNITGKKAIMFSKHAAELLKNATVYKSIASAISDCDIVIGTTGVWNKAKSHHKNALLMEDVARLISKRCDSAHSYTIGLVLGRDDAGMSNEELEECDIIAHIPTSKDYPTLNISHALAIMLYELLKAGLSQTYTERSARAAGRKEVLLLLKEFDALIKDKKIRNKKAIEHSFRKLIANANLNAPELHALITALK